MQIDMPPFQVSETLFSGMAQLLRQGWLVLPTITALFVVVLPLLRFGLLALVLVRLRLVGPAKWLGSAFRWDFWLGPWAMLDVFLLGAMVSYYRFHLVHGATLTIKMGGACFVAAALLGMACRVTLDRRAVWREIAPETENDGEMVLSCSVCDMLQPAQSEGGLCPRCRATLYNRRPYAIARTTALLLAALIISFPANIYPVETTARWGLDNSYTIFGGVREMIAEGLWPIGVLGFITSILVPFGRILALGWCVLCVIFRSRPYLLFRTRLLRYVVESGRWSKTGPFGIAFFVPLIKFGPVGTAQPGWGTTAFIAMSFPTMIASYSFDPRLMWDIRTVWRTAHP